MLESVREPWEVVRARRKKEERVERKGVALEMRAVVKALIEEMYANWARSKGEAAAYRAKGVYYYRDPPEPMLTVTWIRGYLAQAGAVGIPWTPVPRLFHQRGLSYQTVMVQTAVAALVRHGEIGWCWGVGARKNTQAKVYGPKGMG